VQTLQGGLEQRRDHDRRNAPAQPGGWLLNRKGVCDFKDVDSAENKFSEGEFEKE